MQSYTLEEKAVLAQELNSLRHYGFGACIATIGIILLFWHNLLLLLVGLMFILLGATTVSLLLFSLGFLDGLEEAEYAIQKEFGLSDIMAIRKRLNRSYLRAQAAEADRDLAFEQHLESQKLLRNVYEALSAQSEWLDPIELVDNRQRLNHVIHQTAIHLGTNND